MDVRPLLLVLFYGYHGILPSGASPLSGKPGSASGTGGTFHTDLPRHLPGNTASTGPPTGLAGLRSDGNTAAAATFHLPPTAPTPTSGTGTGSSAEPGLTSTVERMSAPLPRLKKRSTDPHSSLFTPDKMLQTVVSVGSVGSVVSTDNDAWSAEPGPAGTSGRHGQDPVCNCSIGGEGIWDPDECNATTGQCLCVSGYTGLQCDECEEGHFTNGTNGCLACACDSYGAVNHLCDSSGTCECKTGVYGPKCDECHPGFFHFSPTGCRPCQCHNHTNNCHPQSGACLNCEGNTQGNNCDECKPGFYRGPGSAPTQTCAPCPCSRTTSNGTCHTDSEGAPVCDRCLPTYAGPRCDTCSAGFYKASGVCVPCDCNGNADPQGPAQICHPDNGHCLRCINNTTGPQCQLCSAGFGGDARAHNCTRLTPRLVPTPADTTTPAAPPSTRSPTTTTAQSSATARGVPSSTSRGNMSAAPGTAATTQTLLTSLSGPTDNTTAALTEVSWTQFNIIILAVIILVVLLLLGFVGGVYTYREYQNRKLNAPFWTIELKEDNISFSSYHDSIPNADVSGLLEDEANEVAPNGQLALTTQGNCYKA